MGASNQFAHAAARAVATQPGEHYNPLFIYGGVGLGKTHLANAIGHAVLERRGRKHGSSYLATDTFMNELISSLRRDRMEEFKRRLRGVDVLILDDVHALAGRERTQEEFFHTFNTLHAQRAQIVLTSDKVPKDIPGLEERLRSRFEWGLIADIQPPDVETRIAILEKKAELEGIPLDRDVALFLASQLVSNVRELEGALTRLGGTCVAASLRDHGRLRARGARYASAVRPMPRWSRSTRSSTTVCERFRARARRSALAAGAAGTSPCRGRSPCTSADGCSTPRSRTSASSSDATTPRSCTVSRRSSSASNDDAAFQLTVQQLEREHPASRTAVSNVSTARCGQLLGDPLGISRVCGRFVHIVHRPYDDDVILLLGNQKIELGPGITGKVGRRARCEHGGQRQARGPAAEPLPRPGGGRATDDRSRFWRTC